MFEGVGAAILGFLVQYAGTDLLDRLVGERIDAFRANREQQKAFDQSVATALAQVEHAHPGHGRIFADRVFLEHHAVVELAKFFSAQALPSVDGLIVRWRDYAPHLPAAAPAIAAVFLSAVRDALIEHTEFRDLFWFKRDSIDSERLRAVGDDVAALRRLLAEMQQRPTSPGRPRVDHLPADLGDFQGRQTEIDRLKAILTTGGGQAAVSAIGGMGGIGKSALAVHVAHLLVEEAPDARLFVDMGARTGMPFAAVRETLPGTSLSPVEAMVKVVALLAPECQVPKEDDAARQAYRAALDGRRLLLVLDNADSSAQVRPLLDWRAPTTMVLITSRRTITAPGLAPIPLDVMPPDEARALLRTTLVSRTADDDQLDLIAARCGHLPLALRVAGTYLAHNPHVTVGAYLAALADEKQRLRHLRVEDDSSLDVYAALALSAQRLAEERPELAAWWRLLAVFPASFDSNAAAAVWDAGTDVVPPALGELRRRSMLLWQAEQRWRLHELMRDVGQLVFTNCATLETRLEAARQRHAEHYSKILDTAGELQMLAGLALYDLEASNIVAAQSWSAEHAETSEVASTLTSSFGRSERSAVILSIRLHPKKRTKWLLAQRDACVHLGDREGEGYAIGNLANVYSDLGEFTQAIDHYEKYLLIARELGDWQGEVKTLNNIGHVRSIIGDEETAITLHSQAMQIACNKGDWQQEMAALRGLGNVLLHLGRLEGAFDYHNQALQVAVDNHDQNSEAEQFGCLGNCWLLGRDPRKAIECYEKALPIFQAIGDRRSEAKTLGGLANAWIALEQTQQAVGHYLRTLDIARQEGNLMDEATTLANLGLAFDALGERDTAIDYTRRALIVFGILKAKPLIQRAHGQLAEWGAADQRS